MPTIISYHRVKDTDYWLASPKREEFFGPLGVSNFRTFVDPQDRTRVAVLTDVADMDALMGAMQSEAAAQTIEHEACCQKPWWSSSRRSLDLISASNRRRGARRSRLRHIRRSAWVVRRGAVQAPCSYPNCPLSQLQGNFGGSIPNYQVSSRRLLTPALRHHLVGELPHFRD
jgi:hypothetical protein